MTKDVEFLLELQCYTDEELKDAVNMYSCLLSEISEKVLIDDLKEKQLMCKKENRKRKISRLNLINT